MQTVRYLDLFSGVGGFPLGLEAAGRQLGIDFVGIGHSEIDRWAIETYERHYDHPNLGDVTEIEPAALPEYDLLLAGFPCQPFSSAGNGEGFADPRGTMFHHVARILRDTRPRNFILENVKGLLSNDAGRTFQTIIGVLTDLGYCVEWQVLDSADHGVPQARQRIFIVGHLGGIPPRPVFPFTGNVGRKVDGDPTRSRYGDRVFGGPVPDTAAGEWFGVVRERIDGYTRRVYRERQISTTIDANYGQGIGELANRTHVARVDGGALRVRRLTPLECERVMGFPDDWTAGHSDRQRYRQMGNAVIPKVVEDVALALYCPENLCDGLYLK